MNAGSLGAGDQQAHKVSFDWISEAWGLFASSAPLWIAAIIVAVYAPLCLDLFVIGAVGLSHKIAHVGGVWPAVTHIQPGLKIGLALLNAGYTAFVFGGLAQIALKQVRGEAVSFRDVFAGGPMFGRMLVFGVVYSLLIAVGSALIVLPGVFAAGLLLPALALTAAGEPVGSALARSVKAMWSDRAIAMGLAFVLGTVTLIGLSFATVGLLATLPLWFLVSALAYRDLFASPEPAVSLDDILGISETGRGVYLGGEASFGYSHGEAPARSVEARETSPDPIAPPRP